MRRTLIYPKFTSDFPAFERALDTQTALGTPVIQRIERAGFIVDWCFDIAWLSVRIYAPNETRALGSSAGINDLDWHAEEAYLIARETLMYRREHAGA